METRNKKKQDVVEEKQLLPDLTDMDEVRKAFIMSEVLNRKY